MQAFVNYILGFIKNLYDTMINVLRNNFGASELDRYYDFLGKQILSGTLINVGLTWRELLVYISTWFLIIFFIVFIFKLVFKVINLICLR